MNFKIFSTAETAFEFFFKFIMHNGRDQKGTKAIFNTGIQIQYPLERTIDTTWRQWDQSYADLEYEWYKSGNPDPKIVAERAKIWKHITDPATGTVNSNYGAAWLKNNQLGRIKEMLRQDPDTRRAVILHYDIADIDKYKLDTPCNIVLNFYKDINNELSLTIFARSIDLVYGFCNDQYCFSKLLEETADDLKTSVGRMTFMITNLHIYEKHYFINERRSSSKGPTSSIKKLTGEA